MSSTSVRLFAAAISSPAENFAAFIRNNARADESCSIDFDPIRQRIYGKKAVIKGHNRFCGSER